MLNSLVMEGKIYKLINYDDSPNMQKQGFTEEVQTDLN